SELGGWTPSAGSWSRRFGDPVPIDGIAAFGSGGGAATAELVQEVSLAPYANRIDHAGQQLLFEGFVQSAAETPPDRGRVVVEYLNAAKSTVLATFDSGEVASAGAWRAVTDLRIVPTGTRFARLHLFAQRHSGTAPDVYFDRIALRSLGVPASPPPTSRV